MYFPAWNRVGKESSQVWESLIGLLYPRVCEVCGKSLVRGEKYLCTGCIVDFPFADGAFSTEGNILKQFEAQWCPERIYTLFYYSKFSDYKNLIYLIKYRSYRRLGEYLGRMLGSRMAGDCHADCIVPVPLHRKREKERGFNQALEIAKGISEVLGVEVVGDAVVRVHNNVSQTGKNAAERLRNVEDIFSLHCPERIRGRHVLLVDDVITTGATMGSCLRVLSAAGEVRFSLGCLAQTI